MCCVVILLSTAWLWNRYGEVIDLVGGRRDIKHKMLRTIGNAQERFEEDALRLFRACRFVAKLDFFRVDLLEAMPKAFHPRTWLVFRTCTK